MPHHTTSGAALAAIDEEMRACIDACEACHDVCLETIEHCLEVGGDHAAPQHILLLSDCAEICQTSANFMLRGSELHVSTVAVCAEVAVRCAEDCASFGDDPLMQACAESCRECAERCLEVAGVSDAPGL